MEAKSGVGNSQLSSESVIDAKQINCEMIDTFIWGNGRKSSIKTTYFENKYYV